ncbi:MAG: carbamoyl phosphate synthase small subunit [Rickettsiaceae bacterium]|jgi:carbamoyl-phosphate synthase small subunit|nr:carbamoyl phosphate synthase small subunit [Rickettsiaceae bacterium]
MTKTIFKNPDAALIFSDGNIIYGFGIGKKGKTIGEICFNTAITGYQEILTDPSYSGQIITFTFPHIGNVGVNISDIESARPKAKGLIINQQITHPASYRSDNHLNHWLINNEITGICGIDTRQITKNIKTQGAKNVAIVFDDNIQNIKLDEILKELRGSVDLGGVELASTASLNKKYQWQDEGKWQQKNNSYNKIADKKLKIVAVDYGAKLNILRCLTEAGCNVEIVPAQTSAEEILKHNPNGVFLSNGPGDPAETAKYAAPMIQKIIEKNIPLFGICLGHQLLALSMGAKTSKMHQGHRGANHPVQDLRTKKVEITSQNHGFCVDEKTLPDSLEVTHRSLFDGTIEGIKVKNKPAFSVQYHPESSPGPSDSYYLFERFMELMSSR